MFRGSKKIISKIFALVMCAVLLLGLVPPAVAKAAGKTVTGDIHVEFTRDDARGMLSDINAFRKSSDAWYWNQDNSTKTVCSGLGDLTYDYGLEQTAMLRAVEISLMFSHTRPDGRSCFTAVENFPGVSINGENIFAGMGSLGTAESAFNGWREDDQMYSGQGHRRLMLSNGFKYVGIAHVVNDDGIDFWVQHFSSQPSNQPDNAGFNASGILEDNVMVEIGQDAINDVFFGSNEKTMSVGDTWKYIDDYILGVVISEGFPMDRELSFSEDEISSVESSDPKIIKVSGHNLVAQSPGKATVHFRIDQLDMDVEFMFQVEAKKPEPSPAPTPTPTPTPTPVGPLEPKAKEVKNGVYRINNIQTGDHFFTTSYKEYKNVIQSPIWKDEGLGFIQVDKDAEGAQPVFRLFNNKTGEHFFTMNRAEYERVGADPSWKKENIGLYAYDKNDTRGVPMYRLYNTSSGMHHFTTSELERNTILNTPGTKWKDEGVFGRVLLN